MNEKKYYEIVNFNYVHILNNQMWKYVKHN